MSNYIYDYQETVRVDGIDGLYIVSSRKTKSLPSGVVTRYYSLVGAVTGKPLINTGGTWWPSSSLKKNYSESYMTFHELMDVLKNDVIQQDDFE
jgi:hypothetical protein